LQELNYLKKSKYNESKKNIKDIIDEKNKKNNEIEVGDEKENITFEYELIEKGEENKNEEKGIDIDKIKIDI